MRFRPPDNETIREAIKETDKAMGILEVLRAHLAGVTYARVHKINTITDEEESAQLIKQTIMDFDTHSAKWIAATAPLIARPEYRIEPTRPTEGK